MDLDIETLWTEIQKKIKTQDQLSEYSKAFNDLKTNLNRISGFPVRILYPEGNVLNWTFQFTFYYTKNKLCVKRSTKK